jgi:hypothetical protein
VLFRGEHAEISTYIEQAIENDFSGNVIDVCPVGALTDRTARFKSRVWFLKPMEAECSCTKCSGKAVVWMFGDEIYRGDLKVVLQDYQPTPLPIHAVYRRSRFYPAKITSFIDFLSEEFKLDPWVSSYGTIVFN